MFISYINILLLFFFSSFAVVVAVLVVSSRLSAFVSKNKKKIKIRKTKSIKNVLQAYFVSLEQKTVRFCIFCIIRPEKRLVYTDTCFADFLRVRFYFAYFFWGSEIFRISNVFKMYRACFHEGVKHSRFSHLSTTRPWKHGLLFFLFRFYFCKPSWTGKRFFFGPVGSRIFFFITNE